MGKEKAKVRAIKTAEKIAEKTTVKRPNNNMKYCQHRDENNVQCTRYSMYGYKCGKREYCSDHKLVDMLNISSPLCMDKKCKQRASFAPPGEKKPQYCGDHQKPGNVNVRAKMCQVCNETQAAYGSPGKPATHCTDCKLAGMINGKSRHCLECAKEDVATIASYGYEGKHPECCLKHKLDGMFDRKNIRCTFVDPNTKKCIHMATYGLEGNNPTHCARHRSDHMVKLLGNKLIKT